MSPTWIYVVNKREIGALWVPQPKPWGINQISEDPIDSLHVAVFRSCLIPLGLKLKRNMANSKLNHDNHEEHLWWLWVGEPQEEGYDVDSSKCLYSILMEEANFKGIRCPCWQSASFVWQWEYNQDWSQPCATFKYEAHWDCDYINRGDIELGYIPTKNQLADMLTKPLDEARFTFLSHELNIVDSMRLTWLSCTHTYILAM